jgi:hypothetical protein
VVAMHLDLDIENLDSVVALVEAQHLEVVVEHLVANYDNLVVDVMHLDIDIADFRVESDYLLDDVV